MRSDTIYRVRGSTAALIGFHNREKELKEIKEPAGCRAIPDHVHPRPDKQWKDSTN